MSALVTSLVLAGIVWQADFEQSNLSEWDSYVLHPEHWSFPSTPAARSGQRCGRVDLQSADTYGQFLRVEVEYTAPMLSAFEGAELYYAWSSQLSSANPLAGTDHEIAFFESNAPTYHQVLGIHVIGSAVTMSTAPQNGSWSERWRGTITRDAWHDFVLHVKWSLDPAVGFVELWYDGAHVVPKTTMRTMVSSVSSTALTGGSVNSFHAGLLLSPVPVTQPDEVVYLDRVRAGTAWEDVVDAPADAGVMMPPPDAGSTPPPDAGSAPPPVDAGSGAPPPVDAGSPAPPAPDAGVTTSTPPSDATGAMGCSQSSSGGTLAFALLLVAHFTRRRRLLRVSAT